MLHRSNHKNQSLTEIVFNHMQEGILVLDNEMRILTMNPWAQRVTGYTEEEIFYKKFNSLFFKKEEYAKVLTHILENGGWTGELLKIRKNGEVYSQWTNIRPVYGEEEEITNYVVVFRDLTKQKYVQYERKLTKKILENISEGVVITDANSRIIAVNPAFEIVTGYMEEEILGQNPKKLQSGLHHKEFYQKMWNDIHNHGKWEGEIWNRRKNGELYPEWITISSIKDQDGKVRNYVAVFTDISDQRYTEEQLRRLAHYDSLTGVENRYSLNKRLKNLINVAKTHNQQFAVLFLDLDHFKQINETLGHSYGDMLLKEVSLRLQSLIKNKDMIARLGGDEFVIVLSNIRHPKEAVQMAENIIDHFHQPFCLNEHEVYISASIGISLYPFDGTKIETLLRNADKAMHEAKVAGRNQYEFYHKDMHQNKLQTLTIQTSLRKALEREEFSLLYQPQVDLKTNEIRGVEALLRWKQKDLGHISPAEFIPLAEESGLIAKINKWVIEKACEDLKKIELSGYNKLIVGINISPLHFYQDSFINSVIDILDRQNVSPRKIEFELTESMIMPNAEEAIRKLVKLKQLGLHLSIDDFGTGYSSLNYLTRFPLDVLKIDQSFVKNIGFPNEEAIIEAIITIAHKLNLKVVAEGVENKKQFDYLKEKNCDMIQGYYISEPLTANNLLEFLKTWNSISI